MSEYKENYFQMNFNGQIWNQRSKNKEVDNNNEHTPTHKRKSHQISQFHTKFNYYKRVSSNLFQTVMNSLVQSYYWEFSSVLSTHILHGWGYFFLLRFTFIQFNSYSFNCVCRAFPSELDWHFMAKICFHLGTMAIFAAFAHLRKFLFFISVRTCFCSPFSCLIDLQRGLVATQINEYL